jgi:NAD+ kinase
MKIALFSQDINKDVETVFQSILSHDEATKCNFFIFKNLRNSVAKTDQNLYEFFDNYSDLTENLDIFVSIGGDGTFLRSIEFVRNLKKENLEKSLIKIFNKKFVSEKRSLLKVTTNCNTISEKSFPYALNEISVVRKDTTSMINVRTSLDGTYINSYWSDGLIVSTPTGSTGYSLSCGGPVISPSSNSLVLTPISPHNLNARPLVISDSTKIEISVEGREDFHLLTIDAKIYTLKNETKIFLEKADFDIKVANINNYNFFKTLKDKLLWGKDKRN